MVRRKKQNQKKQIPQSAYMRSSELTSINSPSSNSSPFLLSNHSVLVPTLSLHATPIDDDVARISMDLAGTFGFIQQQIQTIQTNINNIQNRLKHCEQTTEQIEEKQQQQSPTASHLLV